VNKHGGNDDCYANGPRKQANGGNHDEDEYTFNYSCIHLAASSQNITETAKPAMKHRA